jgi:hypothetical protein
LYLEIKKLKSKLNKLIKIYKYIIDLNNWIRIYFYVKNLFNFSSKIWITIHKFLHLKFIFIKGSYVYLKLKLEKLKIFNSYVYSEAKKIFSEKPSDAGYNKCAIAHLPLIRSRYKYLPKGYFHISCSVYSIDCLAKLLLYVYIIVFSDTFKYTISSFKVLALNLAVFWEPFYTNISQSAGNLLKINFRVPQRPYAEILRL